MTISPFIFLSLLFVRSTMYKIKMNNSVNCIDKLLFFQYCSSILNVCILFIPFGVGGFQSISVSLYRLWYKVVLFVLNFSIYLFLYTVVVASRRVGYKCVVYLLKI